MLLMNQEQRELADAIVSEIRRTLKPFGGTQFNFLYQFNFNSVGRVKSISDAGIIVLLDNGDTKLMSLKDFADDIASDRSQLYHVNVLLASIDKFAASSESKVAEDVDEFRRRVAARCLKEA